MNGNHFDKTVKEYSRKKRKQAEYKRKAAIKKDTQKEAKDGKEINSTNE